MKTPVPAPLAGTGCVLQRVALVALCVGGVGAVAAPDGVPPAAGVVHFFKDGPPARVTGGFEEDSCWACHWDTDENDPGGSLVLEGLPDEFEPGQAYTLTLTLSRPGMQAGGFQLAVRSAADTSQSGHLEPLPGEEDRVGILTERDIQFAQHQASGVESQKDGVVSWNVRWTAPHSPSGPVLVHVAALAGDGDESQIGDFVYTLERELRPAGH